MECGFELKRTAPPADEACFNAAGCGGFHGLAVAQVEIGGARGAAAREQGVHHRAVEHGGDEPAVHRAVITHGPGGRMPVGENRRAVRR